VQWIPTANWQSNFKHYRALERWVALVCCTCAMLMLRVMELTIIAIWIWGQQELAGRAVSVGENLLRLGHGALRAALSRGARVRAERQRIGRYHAMDHQQRKTNRQDRGTRRACAMHEVITSLRRSDRFHPLRRGCLLVGVGSACVPLQADRQ